jgi:hypothetical protein
MMAIFGVMRILAPEGSNDKECFREEKYRAMPPLVPRWSTADGA